MTGPAVAAIVSPGTLRDRIEAAAGGVCAWFAAGWTAEGRPRIGLEVAGRAGRMSDRERDRVREARDWAETFAARFGLLRPDSLVASFGPRPEGDAPGAIAAALLDDLGEAVEDEAMRHAAKAFPDFMEAERLRVHLLVHGDAGRVTVTRDAGSIRRNDGYGVSGAPAFARLRRALAAWAGPDCRFEFEGIVPCDSAIGRLAIERRLRGRAPA